MTARNEIVIDLGRRRLQAVQVARSRNGLRVKRALVEAVPDGLNIDEAKAYGAWAGLQLAKAGFPRTKATIEIAREHVALKRLSLPTSEPSELPEMTRLALLAVSASAAFLNPCRQDRRSSKTKYSSVHRSASHRPGSDSDGFRHPDARETSLSAAAALGLGVFRTNPRGEKAQYALRFSRPAADP